MRAGIVDGHGPSPAQFFILSESQTWDSLVMWRNYGGAQESYAIGLDASAPLQVLADNPDIDPVQFGPTIGTGVNVRRTPWEPVRYTEAEQVALVDAVFDSLPEELGRFRDRLGDLRQYSAFEDIPPDAFSELDDTRDDLEQALLLITHSGFVDERETRKAVVIWASDEDRSRDQIARLVRYRSTSYGMAPYLELTGAGPRRRARRPRRLPPVATADPRRRDLAQPQRQGCDGLPARPARVTRLSGRRHPALGDPLPRLTYQTGGIGELSTPAHSPHVPNEGNW